MLENIYGCFCDFFENKLWRFGIEYKNDYRPTWANFISKAKEKYGEGKETPDGIVWDDGKTTLEINNSSGEQDDNYGNHYFVVYTDNAIASKSDKKEKGQAPNF